MSNLIHCDGPGCDKTTMSDLPPRRFDGGPWIHVEQGELTTLDFHSRVCLARWAVGDVGDRARDAVRNVLDSQPCTCHNSQIDPHTKAEHQAYPEVVDGL